MTENVDALAGSKPSLIRSSRDRNVSCLDEDERVTLVGWVAFSFRALSERTISQKEQTVNEYM